MQPNYKKDYQKERNNFKFDFTTTKAYKTIKQLDQLSDVSLTSPIPLKNFFLLTNIKT